MHLCLAGYAFLALVVLRGWAARVYANAVARALDGPEAGLWAGSALAEGQVGKGRAWKLTHWLRLTLLAAIWFGLAAQVLCWPVPEPRLAYVADPSAGVPSLGGVARLIAPTSSSRWRGVPPLALPGVFEKR